MAGRWAVAPTPDPSTLTHAAGARDVLLRMQSHTNPRRGRRQESCYRAGFRGLLDRLDDATSEAIDLGPFEPTAYEVTIVLPDQIPPS